MLSEDELAAQHTAMMVAYITYMVIFSDSKSKHFILTVKVNTPRNYTNKKKKLSQILIVLIFLRSFLLGFKLQRALV